MYAMILGSGIGMGIGMLIGSIFGNATDGLIIGMLAGGAIGLISQTRDPDDHHDQHQPPRLGRGT